MPVLRGRTFEEMKKLLWILLFKGLLCCAHMWKEPVFSSDKTGFGVHLHHLTSWGLWASFLTCPTFGFLICSIGALKPPSGTTVRNQWDPRWRDQWSCKLQASASSALTYSPPVACDSESTVLNQPGTPLTVLQLRNWPSAYPTAKSLCFSYLCFNQCLQQLRRPS